MLQDDELALSAAIQEAQVKVHEALTDSCPTSHVTNMLLFVMNLQEDELALSAAIQEAQVKVHEALTDNINTAGALDALSSFIKATNLYLAGKQAAAAAADGVDASGLLPAGPQPLLLRKAAAFMTRILSVMGVLPVSG
jgi:cysteinyl-tRNA synthetase